MRSLIGGALAALLFATPATAQQEMFPGAAQAGYPITLPNGKTVWAPALAAVTPAAAAAVTPLAGTSSGAQTAGPFTPILGRPIIVALSGTWSGTVQLLRSTDGGTTKLPLTPAGVTLGTYTAQGVDTPWVETEAGATFYLSLPSAGISYRVSQ